jgi:hypothetical protein
MAAAFRDVEAATLALDGSPPVTTNHPTDVPCPLPRRIAWVRVSIASPHVRPSQMGRVVGIRIVTFEMLWGGGEEIASIVADVNRWSPQCKSRTT